jgi:hypothetical protein
LKEAARAPKMGAHADVAQLVEHHLAKVGVAGSNPVVRSRDLLRRYVASEPKTGSEAFVRRSPRPRTIDAGSAGDPI